VKPDMNKPKVLVCVLCGVERQNWINPDLSINLIQMARDTRFDVNYLPVRDRRPWPGARNTTIVAARQIDADWVISFDNDNFVPGMNPLDIIADAGDDKHVIGMSYGLGADSGNFLIYPSEGHGEWNGDFREEQSIGGGVMMVRNIVWKTIPKGPWYRWVDAESETLVPVPGITTPEDQYFCTLVRKFGIKVWSHRQFAGHYRSVDVTGMVCTLSRMGAK
jgi:hypothetical protein